MESTHVSGTLQQPPNPLFPLLPCTPPSSRYRQEEYGWRKSWKSIWPQPQTLHLIVGVVDLVCLRGCVSWMPCVFSCWWCVMGTVGLWGVSPLVCVHSHSTGRQISAHCLIILLTMRCARNRQEATIKKLPAQDRHFVPGGSRLRAVCVVEVDMVALRDLAITAAARVDDVPTVRDGRCSMGAAKGGCISKPFCLLPTTTTPGRSPPLSWQSRTAVARLGAQYVGSKRYC